MSSFFKQNTEISGWGLFPALKANVYEPTKQDEITSVLKEHGAIIARGMGRSYGDSALQKNIISLRQFHQIEEIDTQNDTVWVDAGISFDELLSHIVPQGYFLPVVPGTKFVTIGGAIGCDIHGKNHHLAGTFSQHVLQLTLLIGDQIFECSPTQNEELFFATCGGMGLTGVIVRAKIHLIRLQSSEILQTAQKVQSLVELTRFFEAHKDAMYTVAWIDCTQTGSRLGRSVFFAGEHGQERGKLEVHKKKSVPFPSIPFPVVFPWNIKVFNHLYYCAHTSNTKPKHVHYDPFFFPLDRIGNWNRMYGRKGFIQYQCVFPKSVGLDPMVEVLTKVAKSGRSSFLAVLKYFGPENQNFLSFPMEGWTLSLDFMLHRELFELLTECDTIVARAGGRVYLAKDARLSKSHFQAMYPKFQHVMQIRKKYSIENLQSLQSERLGF